jgi:hypothetical protein
MSVDDFSGYSNDIIINSVINEALSVLITESFSGVLNHNFVRADEQSHVTVKLIRIRFRVNPRPKRPQELKVILRLKDFKLSKRVKKKKETLIK